MFSRNRQTIARNARHSVHNPRSSRRRHLFGLSTSSGEPRNRIYEPVRRPDEFWSYHSLASSSRRGRPLITFWSASYCRTCAAVSPVLYELLQNGLGEEHGGVSFCEVEYDSPDIMSSGLGMTFMVTKIPLLLPFKDGEPLQALRVTDPKAMADRQLLTEWIAEIWKQGR